MVDAERLDFVQRQQNFEEEHAMFILQWQCKPVYDAAQRCTNSNISKLWQVMLRVQKTRGFFKKPNPVGFIGFWGFIGFFWTSRKK